MRVANSASRSSTGRRWDAYSVPSFDGLRRGEFGVLEPDPDRAARIAPDRLDLVIVPGVAFTAGGARLGRGGGFYDRFLARVPDPTPRVGVAFRCQVFDQIPTEPHDAHVDELVVGGEGGRSEV